MNIFTWYLYKCSKRRSFQKKNSANLWISTSIRLLAGLSGGNSSEAHVQLITRNHSFRSGRKQYMGREMFSNSSIFLQKLCRVIRRKNQCDRSILFLKIRSLRNKPKCVGSKWKSPLEKNGNCNSRLNFQSVGLKFPDGGSNKNAITLTKAIKSIDSLRITLSYQAKKKWLFDSREKRLESNAVKWLSALL